MQTAEYRPSRQEYREVYLRSPHWLEIRQEALARAGRRCQVCNGSSHLDVHHRTYARLGNEEPGDLTVLCRDCHKLFHGARRTVGTAARRPTRPGSPSRMTWRTMTNEQRDALRRNVLRALVESGGHAGTQPLAAIVDQPSRIVGQCLTTLRRDELVVRPKKSWHLTNSGEIAASVTNERPGG